jgi:hypothetical protein
MDYEGYARTPGLRSGRWFHELPGDPSTVDGSAVVWPDDQARFPLVIPAQRRSPEDW